MPGVKPILVWCVWVTTASLLTLGPLETVEVNKLQPWRRVLVSQAKVFLNRYERRTIRPGPSQALQCAVLCQRLEWCNLYCSNTSSLTCDFSNLKITYNYVESELDHVLTCYTPVLKDYAITANITHGEQSGGYQVRTINNLQDGYHDVDNVDDCFLSRDKSAAQWILLDFGSIVTFSHVILAAQANSRASYHFQNVEVRVGNSTPVMTPDDFSAFDFFGKFEGKASSGQVVNMTTPSPVLARYMSVQKTTGIGGLQVCHVSVLE